MTQDDDPYERLARADDLGPTFEDVADEDLDALTVDVAVQPKDLDYDRRVQSANAKQSEQANDFRTVFFVWAITAASTCILGSSLVVGWQLYRAAATDTVLVAYITGLSVEALGITAIMARYLFPDGGHRRKGNG